MIWMPLILLAIALLAAPALAEDPSPMDIVHLLPVPSAGGYWTSAPQEIKPIAIAAEQRRVLLEVDRGTISFVEWETDEEAALNVPPGRRVVLTESLLGKLGTWGDRLDPLPLVADEMEGSVLLVEVVDGAGFACGSWHAVVICGMSSPGSEPTEDMLFVSAVRHAVNGMAVLARISVETERAAGGRSVAPAWTSRPAAGPKLVDTAASASAVKDPPARP